MTLKIVGTIYKLHYSHTDVIQAWSFVEGYLKCHIICRQRYPMYLERRVHSFHWILTWHEVTINNKRWKKSKFQINIIFELNSIFSCRPIYKTLVQSRAKVTRTPKSLIHESLFLKCIFPGTPSLFRRMVSTSKVSKFLSGHSAPGISKSYAQTCPTISLLCMFTLFAMNKF